MNKKWRDLASQLLREAGERHPSEMLERASELYGRHGCNDFEFPKGWTAEEIRDFVRLEHEWNGDPEDFDPENPVTPDFSVMAFLAAMMRTNP